MCGTGRGGGYGPVQTSLAGEARGACLAGSVAAGETAPPSALGSDRSAFTSHAGGRKTSPHSGAMLSQ